MMDRTGSLIALASPFWFLVVIANGIMEGRIRGRCQGQVFADIRALIAHRHCA